MIGVNWVKTLAISSLLGMDWVRMAELDPLARRLAVEVIREAMDFQEKRDRHMAQMIIEELALAMNRK